MKTPSLLADFEELPSLREKSINCTGTRRRIALLLEQEPIIEDIIVSIDKQRVRRDELDLMRDMRPVSDHVRRETLSRIPATPARNIQLAYSLPVDYRVQKWDIPDTSETDIIESVVIQPEYISDDFMVSLGYMTEGEKRTLSYEEKIHGKIEKIAEIKSIYKTAHSIQLGKWRESGRILRIDMPGKKYHGQYIVFQETTDIEMVAAGTRWKKRMERKVIPRVYGSVFSLIRSQEYALSGMSDRLSTLRDIRDSDIPRLSMKWKDDTYDDAARQTDLTSLKSKLIGKSTYHERMALEERIGKIALRHPEQDFQRLRGACNDIIQAIESKIGKKSELRKQLDWLTDLESKERWWFDTFYRTLIEHLESINTRGLLRLSLLEIPISGDEIHLSWTEKGALGNLWFIIKTYARRNNTSLKHWLWYPYHEIDAIIWDHLRRFESNGNIINKEYLRISLSIILEMKKHAYNLLLEEIIHYKKRSLRTPLPHEKIRLLEKLDFIRASLVGIPFLRNIPLTEHGKERYTHMRDTLMIEKEQLTQA